MGKEKTITGTENQDTNNGQKFSIKSLFRFAEAWLREHFGSFLGEDGVLNKAAAFLCTILILYFNYLKHRYDTAYFHGIFGVPEEYLGAAWNATMSDFVLNALLGIVQGTLILAIVLTISILLFLLCRFLAREKHAYSKAMSIISVCVLGISIVIWLCAPFYRTVSKWMLQVIAYMVGGILFLGIVLLIWDAYKKAGLKESKESCVSVKKDDPGDGTDNNSTPSEASGILSVRAKRAVAAGVIIGIMLCGAGAEFLGKCMASLETDMMYISPDETVSEQLNKLTGNGEDTCQAADYWAVICRSGENYVIMPCTIRSGDGKHELTVYPKYHCVIASEGLVVLSDVFTRVIIDGNTLINENGWSVKGLGGRSSGGGAGRDFKEPTEPTSQTEPTDPSEPTLPTDATEPTEPDETMPTEPDGTVPTEPDETVPPEPDETVHSETCITEMNVYYTWNCGCCRCTPGLG